MATDSLWYKDAIFYELSVRAFYDGNGDGIGDFIGAGQKLTYLHDLGVSCICLLPFYVSPLKDDGYDISDHYAVHPAYGTLGDCRNFITAAHAHGFRVITDLVLNHTSDQHPWFIDARSSRRAARRDWYVWSDSPQTYQETRVRFPDSEEFNWAWDPQTRQYYWHRFFAHQPDLNFHNAAVRHELLRVARFWLDLGFDGLRCSGIDYLCERAGSRGEGEPETYAYSRALCAELTRTHPGCILLGDTTQWPQHAAQLFGDGDKFHLVTHAPLISHLFLALARQDGRPIADVLLRTPPIPEQCQWSIFLRNHDELQLADLTEDERAEMYQQYGDARHMRLYGGIRRRLAPLMHRDLRKLELLYRFLLSLPGSPMLYYGDDIGMTGKVYLHDRNGLRTPMQWSSDRNAGFSTAESIHLTAPVDMDPQAPYFIVNVEEQSRLSYSLVGILQRLIATRQRTLTFGRGSIEVLQLANTQVLVYLRQYLDESILVINNLSDRMQSVSLDLSRFCGVRPLELCDGVEFPLVKEHPYCLCVGPYGSIWLQLRYGCNTPQTKRLTA